MDILIIIVVILVFAAIYSNQISTIKKLEEIKKELAEMNEKLGEKGSNRD